MENGTDFRQKAFQQVSEIMEQNEHPNRLVGYSEDDLYRQDGAVRRRIGNRYARRYGGWDAIFVFELANKEELATV